MRYQEFRRAVRENISLPKTIGVQHLHSWWVDYLGLDSPGSGIPLDYTEDHVRRAVAWLLWSNLTGMSNGGKGPQGALVKKAAETTAKSDGGWVAISNGEVSWFPDYPISLLPYGLAALRTPEWGERAKKAKEKADA